MAGIPFKIIAGPSITFAIPRGRVVFVWILSKVSGTQDDAGNHHQRGDRVGIELDCYITSQIQYSVSVIKGLLFPQHNRIYKDTSFVYQIHRGHRRPQK